MKKLAIAVLVAAALSGCSSEEEKVDLNDRPVEIKLSAGIFGLQTKAPVNTGDNITASFVASATTGDYTTNAWNATATFIASTTASTSFSFNTPKYYPVDGSSVYIKGYFPAGTISGKTVTYTETDGSNDVMITPQVSGSKATVTPLAFTFNHLLTQLQFKLVASTGYDVTKTVTKIVVKSQQTPATLTLNDGTLTYNTNDVTLSGAFAISLAGTAVGVYPMVKSGVPVVLSVTTSDGVTYPDATISLTTVTGDAHLITLTFTPKEITATAIVTQWITGGTGSSTLQ